MREDDYTFATYRGHNHALSRGAPMGPLYAELFGRANGLMGGKGGSMHITDVSHHMMGSYAIVGAHLPIALGAAWSAQYRKSGQVAVCFFGDGTTNIGAFHEALNMAAVWKAPVVFVCENNQYMEYTAIGDVTAVARPAADRASAYGLEPIVVDGNDVEAVYAVASRAIDRARAGEGPSLVEARHVPPRRPLPRGPRQVPAGRRGRGLEGARPDPGPAGAAARGRRRRGDARRDRRRGEGEVAEAEAFARAGAEPSTSVIETQVWADGGSSWRSRPCLRPRTARPSPSASPRRWSATRRSC